MKVRALGASDMWVGFYNHVRRRGGDVFTLIPQEGLDKDGKPKTITPDQQFSKRWMERVDDLTPETRPIHFNQIGAGQPKSVTIDGPTAISAVSRSRSAAASDSVI